MRTVPLPEAEEHLAALVDAAEATHEIVQIIRDGRVAAVIMSADDFESLNETLHAFRTPGAVEELAQADSDYAAGKAVTGGVARRRHQ